MRKIVSLTLLTAAIALPCTAVAARSVYLNGFDISDVRDKTFEKAKITIDEDGNIHIEASQYDVKIVHPPKDPLNHPGGANPTLTQKYYLVTTPSKQGRAQYDFLVTVNGKKRRLVKAGAAQAIVEISAWLKKGTNEVVLTAKKNLTGGRKSFSSSDKATVLVGTGREVNKIVKIEHIEGELAVDATDLQDETKRLTIVAE